MQALMEAAPGDEPLTSREEIQPLREAVADCIEQLSLEHQFVIDAVMSERVSIRALARRLGVGPTQAFRIRNQAYDKLREIASQHPYLKELYGT